MSGDRSLLQLSVGVVLRFDGLDWTVEEIQAQRGRVVLRADSGERQVRTIKWLMHHPSAASSPPVRMPVRLPQRLIRWGGSRQPGGI